MKRTIAIACMLVLLAPMPALAADLVVDAPDTVLVGESFVVTVTAERSPVEGATVFFSLGDAQFQRTTNATGMTTFTPTTTGELLITATKSPEHTQGSKTIMVVESMIKGDLNGDGHLTPTDAAIALQIAVGSRPCDHATLTVADVSGDGRVTSLDALMILQAAAGVIEL
ncbi:MAG: dockerin type I repeat-containing protein [Euryarchaeota archaeon]|nr:dockerin type I repeat-containing protein [Euryarchaeota archaeon]